MMSVCCSIERRERKPCGREGILFWVSGTFRHNVASDDEEDDDDDHAGEMRKKEMIPPLSK